jgi:flagellar basal-body rod protein FlgF
MDTSTYIALSGQNARQHQMEVLANNIANLSTPGFKAEKMMFQEYLSKPTDGSDPSSYVVSQGNARDMSQGPLNHTGNPLDVALNGAGFMTVTTPTGNQYTRNGHLQLDNQGELVTSAGLIVQGDGGSPIVIPAGAGSITIGKDGTVATDKQTIGKIAVVNFDNPQLLAETQSGLYTTTQTAQPATTTNVEQGTIEEANIQPVVEMTKLMNAAHEIGMAKNFADGEHTRIKNAIDRLGKTV